MKIMKACGAWIAANRTSLAGYDPSQPALTRIDRLSGAQIRAIARALDPIAACAGRGGRRVDPSTPLP